ncbi:MAG TPA: RidA family protein [Chloroflexota bacterium]|nr:RidA family protein [Chloroflexota bacterium]
MTPEERLTARGMELPAPPTPVGNYVPAIRVGNLVFLSGHGPNQPNGPQWQGKVGQNLDIEQGQAAAQSAMLNLLASLKAEIGELSRVKRVIKLLGMVNCTPDFGAQPKVINGASDLLVDLFDDRGRHARSAVGMASLPNNIPVEIEMIAEVATVSED